MKQTLIQLPTKTPMRNWMDYTTVHFPQPDIDQFVCDMVVEHHRASEFSEAELVVSRTRLEFPGEHYVWANSEYLKSLGNEEEIYLKFRKEYGY